MSKKKNNNLHQSDPDLILFRDLPKDAVPKEDLPELVSDIQYRQNVNPRCAICNSPWRDMAEHAYITYNKQIQPVRNFFEYYFSAKLNYTQIKTHMENHCNFAGVYVSGLKNYEHRESEISAWRYRENHLAITALMVELDEIRGMDVGKNKELLLKRAALIEKLATKINDLAKQRDENALGSIGGIAYWFGVMEDLHANTVCAPDKQLIKNKLEEIKIFIQEQASKMHEE